MNSATDIILTILGLILFFGFGAFGWLSIREREYRAAWIAFGLAVLTSLPFFLASLLPIAIKLVILGGIVALGVAAVLLFLLPIGRIERGHDVPHQRVDERDIMFARARLAPGSPEYTAYYALRSENQASDDKTRTLPGLLSPTASKYNRLASASTRAGFSLTEALRDKVSGPVATERATFSAEQMTAYLKNLARYYGACTVGITELQPYHVYTHIGRGAGEYGAPITLNHQYAIAFTVEMDYDLIGPAPDTPVVMESARQYVESAKVAVQLGTLIRSLGYPARAHIDGNYRVIAPLVARDAGLGEIGRMGLLMTPELGPRVRLRGIGPTSAWLFVKEFFGWRQFRNRREVGALSGLTPTPHQSGDGYREQGIDKAGNRHIRAIAIEIAWAWLRFQPDSALSRWYQERFGHGNSRMRRVGIVALARKLLIALWRYLETGEVPEGAVLKSVPV
jgi:hypothetical protein